MFSTISLKIENGIGHLVLDQPPANTMTRKFFDELSILTREVLPGSAIKALVMYGSGRHFSAGADQADLKTRVREHWHSEDEGQPPSFLLENLGSFHALEKMKVPTFAAIRGACLGSGLELALCCKYRVCGEGAVLGMPESTFGLMPGCGGTVKLPALAGRARAMEMILGGRNFSAQEAYEWGIVHKVVPRKRVVEEAVELAMKIGRAE